MKHIANGAADVTTYFVMRDATTHAPKADAAITDIDVYYQEQGAAQAAKADLTALAAADSAHADSKGFHCGNAVYRIDWPDAAFDGGVGKEVVLIVVCAGCDTVYERILLSPPVDAVSIEGSDATNQIRDSVVDDATRLDASALNTLSTHDPGENIMGATDLGTGSGLSALPWNAAWDAEVQSECADALAAYDPPTKTELDSAVSPLATSAALATVDGNVDSILADTGTDGVVLAADAITAAKIADDAISSEHLATGALTADAFAADAIVAATLATDAITDDAIATGAVASTAFAAGAINAAAIADGAIDAATFAAGAIDAAAIANGAIDNATFAADVGSTAFATNIMALATDKALGQGNVAAILEDTGTTLDTLIKDVPTNAELATALAGADDAVLSAIAALPTDADVNAACDSAISDAALATAANLAIVDGNVDSILTDTGTTLDTLIKDIPTVAEFEARTIAAADYLVASDTLARVTLVDTTTTNTDMVAAAPSAADVADAVWDEDVTTHTTADSTGEALTDAGGAGTPPTVGEIADAVWDEALGGHASVGSTGAALSAAGGSGDPWSTAIPGSYGDGTAGQKLGDIMDDLENGGRTDLLIDAIKAKTDALGGYAVTVVSPVASSGTVTLNEGDDYDNTHGRAVTFTLLATGVPDLTGATVVLKTQESSWTATSCTSDGTNWTVLFEPTAADTAALTFARQDYEVEATLSDGDVATLTTGTLVVNRDVA